MAYQRKSARRTSGRRTSQRHDNRTGFAGRLLIMLAVVAAIVLGVALFFRVRTVEVQGNRIYSADQVIEISGVEVGDNLLMVNRAAVNGNITARMPYVLHTSVGLILPDTVVIKIEESEVAGVVMADVGSTWYINTAGRILGSTMDGFDGQVIELNGFTVTAPEAGQQAKASEDMEDSLHAALSVLSQMEGSGLLDLVTSVNTEKSYDIRMLCGEQYEVLLGGANELDYKIWYLKEVLNLLEPYQRGTIDVTLDQERKASFEPWTDRE